MTSLGFSSLVYQIWQVQSDEADKSTSEQKGLLRSWSEYLVDGPRVPVKGVQVLFLVTLRAAMDGSFFGANEINVFVFVVKCHRVTRRKPETLFVVLGLVLW